MDGSPWSTLVDTTETFIDVFSEEVRDVNFGIGIFASKGAILHKFDANTDRVKNVIRNWEYDDSDEILDVGFLTSYDNGLQAFDDAVRNSSRDFTNRNGQQSDTLEIAVFISDGTPNPGSEDGELISQTLRGAPYNAEIVGIIVGSSGHDNVCRVSSCVEHVDCDDPNDRTCSLFIESTNFDELKSSIVNVSHAVAATVPTLSNTREKCEKAPWLGFLALLLPLLAVLVAPLCVSDKREFVEAIPVKEAELATTAPPKRSPEPKGDNKYKWKIASSDKYLWSSAGGTAPMHVDYAGKAPPSAPKDLSKPKVQVVKETWMGEDGKQYQKVEEEQSLEDWFENTFCCCCKKTS